MTDPIPVRRTATPRAGARRHQRGFSFIEILIVMGLIAVLVGGVIVAIGIWTGKAPEFATQNTLNKVKASVEDWKRTYGMYPPVKVSRIAEVTGVGATQVTMENAKNEAIEALYQALSWPGFRSEVEWDDGETSNHDEDALGKAINKHGTTALLEIVDGWNGPLVYIPSHEYAKADQGALQYEYTDANSNLQAVSPQAWRRDDGTFYNPSTFQLYSMGPDGEPNTDDDITTWDR